MAFAQVLSDLDPELKPETTANVTSEKENWNSPEIRDEKGLKCLSNYEDTAFDMENLMDQHFNTVKESVDTEVDIIECGNADDLRMDQAEDPNATEYSSSFDNTISGAEDGSSISDSEVKSRIGGGNESVSYGFDNVFPTRRKKLTPHWRRFIRPLMWRCKWLELRIKQFQSQASKFDKVLAECDQRKQLDSGKHALEGCCMRSLPFSTQFLRKKAMKRRKRKRVEDTVDLSLYMSRHSLFSYYENKRYNVDGFSFDDDCTDQVIAAEQNPSGGGEFGGDFELPLVDSGDGDNPLEQILWKIEVAQSRVHKLKTQLDKVMSSNAGRLSSAENLNLLPSEVPSSSARSPTVSLGKGYTTQSRVLCTPPPHVSKHKIGDLVLPEKAVSVNGKANFVPDIIERTVGLLSADICLYQPQIGDLHEDIEDDLLIHNHSMHEDFQSFEFLKVQLLQKPCDPAKEQEENKIFPVSESEPYVAQKIIAADDQVTRSSCFTPDLQVPKNKRKRGERRAGFGSWSKKSSDEPEH